MKLVVPKKNPPNKKTCTVKKINNELQSCPNTTNQNGYHSKKKKGCISRI